MLISAFNEGDATFASLFFLIINLEKSSSFDLQKEVFQYFVIVPFSATISIGRDWIKFETGSWTYSCGQKKENAKFLYHIAIFARRCFYCGHVHCF